MTGESSERDVGSAGPSAFGLGSVGKHTLVYGVGTLASRAVSFLMLPIYTRYLSPADYGVMGLIEMTLDVIAIFAGAQIALGIFRYYHKAESDDERNAVVSTATLGLGASYIGVGALCFLGAPFLSRLVFGSDVHVLLIRLASVSMVFGSLTFIPLAYARVEDRSTLFVAANLAKLGLAFTLNAVLLIGFGLGILGVFLSTLISSAVVGLALAAWTVRRVGVRFSRGAGRDLLRYGLPLVATQLATFIATFSDRFFLKAAADEAVVGVYQLAYQFGFLLASLGYIPFESVWAPKRFSLLRHPERDAIYNRAFELENLMLLTCGLGIVLYVDDVLRIMTTPPFFGAASLVPIICIAYVFQAWAGAHDIGIYVREKTEYVTLANWVAAGVALVAYAVLIPRYLGVGAALGTVASFFVRWALTYAFSQRLWPVRWRWGPTLRLSALVAAIGGVGLALPVDSLPASIAAHTGLLLLSVPLAWALAVTPATREELRSMARAALARWLSRAA